jgi:hypothetical protein
LILDEPTAVLNAVVEQALTNTRHAKAMARIIGQDKQALRGFVWGLRKDR